MDPKHDYSAELENHLHVNMKRKILKDYRENERWKEKSEPVAFVEQIFDCFEHVRTKLTMPDNIEDFSDGQKHAVCFYLSWLIEALITHSPEKYDVILDNLNYEVLSEYKRLDDILFPAPVLISVPSPMIRFSKINQVYKDVARMQDLSEIIEYLLEHKRAMMDGKYDDRSHPDYDEMYIQGVEQLFDHYKQKLDLQIKLKALQTGKISLTVELNQTKETQNDEKNTVDREIDVSEFRGLSIPELAMWYYYAGKMIHRGNANQRVKKIGFNSGERLYRFYNFYNNNTDRRAIPDPPSKRKIRNIINSYSKVIELLPDAKKGKAIDEQKIFLNFLDECD